MNPSNRNSELKTKPLPTRTLTRVQKLKTRLAFEYLVLEHWGVEYAQSEYGHPLNYNLMIKDCKESVQSSLDYQLGVEDLLSLLLSAHFGIEASKIKDCEYVESFDPNIGEQWILSFDTDSEVLAEILREEIEQSKDSVQRKEDANEVELNMFATKQNAYVHANKTFNLFERYCTKMQISCDAEFEMLRG